MKFVVEVDISGDMTKGAVFKAIAGPFFEAVIEKMPDSMNISEQYEKLKEPNLNIGVVAEARANIGRTEEEVDDIETAKTVIRAGIVDEAFMPQEMFEGYNKRLEDRTAKYTTYESTVKGRIGTSDNPLEALLKRLVDISKEN